MRVCFRLMLPVLCAASAWLGGGMVAAQGAGKGAGRTAGQVAGRGSAGAGVVMSGADASAFQAATQAYEAGNLQAARPVLERLAGKYPGSEPVQAAAGMTLAELGEVAGALPYLRRAHRLAPQDADLTNNLAVALLKTNAAGEAVPLLEEAARKQPRDPELMLRLAQAQVGAGQPAAAARSYAATAALLRAGGQPVEDDLRHDWAVALLSAKQPAQAVAVLEGAPDAASSAAFEELLGEAEEQAGHAEKAVAHLKRAAELEPSEANLYSYASELMKHWTFPAAIEVLTFATQRYPASDRLQTALGVAYYGNSAYARAVPIFVELLRRQPESGSTADLLGRSCSALGGAQEEGCTTLRGFAEAHPDNAPASLYAAIAILHQPADKQDTAAAEHLLRNALRVDARLAEAWYQLAVLQQSRADWTGSVEALRKAVEARPEYPEAHYRLARAYSHLGRGDEAAQEIALQQKYASDEKAAEQKRMREVTTFLITSK